MKRNNSLREKYEKRKKERQDILNFSPLETDPIIEKQLISVLQLPTTVLPTNTHQLKASISSILNKTIAASSLNNLIKKLAKNKIIQCKEISISNEIGYEIHFLDHEMLNNFYSELLHEAETSDTKAHVKEEASVVHDGDAVVSSLNDTSDIMSLLSLPSTKEKQSKQVGEEILELLSKPTAKERSLVEKFKSQGGTQVITF
jgi:mRNA (2'-O-methyladenosine-N6-)-methyltransferase